MVPGALLGILVEQLSVAGQIQTFTVAFLGTSLIASANYTINEFLDKDFDRHHPAKQKNTGWTGCIGEVNSTSICHISDHRLTSIIPYEPHCFIGRV